MREETSGADRAGAGEDEHGVPAGGVLTLVCFKCGTEYYFTDSRPSPEMSCEKCGNTVFREFYSTDDEAARDFAETTERDLDPDDAEGDTLPGDVLDLNLD